MKYILLINILTHALILTTHIREVDPTFLQVNAKTETNTKAHKLMDYLIEYEGVISNPKNVN